MDDTMNPMGAGADDASTDGSMAPAEGATEAPMMPDTEATMPEEGAEAPATE